MEIFIPSALVSIEMFCIFGFNGKLIWRFFEFLSGLSLQVSNVSLFAGIFPLNVSNAVLLYSVSHFLLLFFFELHVCVYLRVGLLISGFFLTLRYFLSFATLALIFRSFSRNLRVTNSNSAFDWIICAQNIWKWLERLMVFFL